MKTTKAIKKKMKKKIFWVIQIQAVFPDIQTVLYRAAQTTQPSVTVIQAIMWAESAAGNPVIF